MNLLVITRSDSYEKHLSKVLTKEDRVLLAATPQHITTNHIATTSAIILHRSSFIDSAENYAARILQITDKPLGVASDIPQLEEMLRFSSMGARAYFNSYMAATHYQQMLEMIVSGQYWYHPTLIQQAMKTAKDVVQSKQKSRALLEELTQREREVADYVAMGLHNNEIADRCNITERTVKAHLTKIFKKTGVSDRTALVVFLNNARLS